MPYTSLTSRTRLKNGWTRYGVQVDTGHFFLYAKGEVLAEPKGRTKLVQVGLGWWDDATVVRFAGERYAALGLRRKVKSDAEEEE